jgi:hypothetical protein
MRNLLKEPGVRAGLKGERPSAWQHTLLKTMGGFTAADRYDIINQIRFKNISGKIFMNSFQLKWRKIRF